MSLMDILVLGKLSLTLQIKSSEKKSQDKKRVTSIYSYIFLKINL